MTPDVTGTGSYKLLDQKCSCFQKTSSKPKLKKYIMYLIDNIEVVNILLLMFNIILLMINFLD